MAESYEFLKQVLDTITEHIVVIDARGDILYVNRSWIRFAHANQGLHSDNWVGINYLSESDKAAAMGDALAALVERGIREVIAGEKDFFHFEYPCHSPDEQRWFVMRVSPFTIAERACYVISHQNITERKLAEEAVLRLSHLDGLTGIANRRSFDEFVMNEWSRCRRLNMPISLAMIDIDHFKKLNDTYGHQSGDDCLKLVAEALSGIGRRPGDMCARYGGEEFASVYGNTNLAQAHLLAERALASIRALNIPNEKSPIHPTVTVSIGLACMQPSEQNTVADLIAEADRSLYLAKRYGGDTIITHEALHDIDTH